MTASITDFDRNALISTLNFQKPAVVTASTFNRPNISYAVERKISDGHGIKRILKFIAKRRKECGIVYSATIGQCIKVAEALQEAGLKVGICHGVRHPPGPHPRWSLADSVSILRSSAKKIVSKLLSPGSRRRSK